MSMTLSPEARRFDALHAQAQTLRAQAQHLLDRDCATLAHSMALATRVNALMLRCQLVL